MIDFKYRPDVDGLRAVAVIMVLLFHAGLHCPGGYVGVDIFFVISGFLITGLVLKEQDAGTFSLSNFWVRRIRRIIPAATAVVVAVILAGYFILLPSDYVDLGESAIAQQIMLSNVYFWQNTGYFDGPSDLKPLLHTWSLSVEEQFYLGYPFLLIFLKRFPRRVAGAFLATLALTSLAVSEYGVQHHPSATFYLLPTRAWELLLGGLIWYVPPPTRIKPSVLNILSWMAVVGIITAGLRFTSTTTFPGIHATLPCTSAAVLIHANSCRTSLPAALLASKPFVFVGLVSYSLYLWHWPILAYLRYRVGENLGAATTSGALVLSMFLAILSWRLIETPFRRRAVLGDKRLLVGTALAGIVSICIVSAYIRVDGVRRRYEADFLDIVEVPYAGRNHGAVGDRQIGWSLPVIGDETADDSVPDFVLWGDSFAKCLSSSCADAARRVGVKGYDAGLGGTPPLLGAWTGTENEAKSNSFNKFVANFAESKKVEWLILFAGWDIHADGLSHLRNSKTEDCFEALKQGFEATLSFAASHDIKVAVILQPPYQWEHVPSKVAREVLNGSASVSYGITRARHVEYQAKARNYFLSLGKQIKVVHADEFCFGSNDLSIIGRDGTPFYSDAGHPSSEGVRAFFEVPLQKLFTELAAP